MKQTLGNCLLGTAATGGGIAISLSSVEQWMRIGSLTIGISIGIWTLYRMHKYPPNSREPWRDDMDVE